LVYLLVCLSAGAAPELGDYSVSNVAVTDAGLEVKIGIETRDYVITYPTNAGNEKFPLVTYAHGAAGGRIDMLAYQKHFNDLAAYGFVVIAPKSCFMGCRARPRILPLSRLLVHVCHGLMDHSGLHLSMKTPER